MSELKIETCIPFPSQYRGFSREFRNALGLMRVGDSIFLDNQSKAQNASTYAKKMGIPIKRAKEGTGWRLWKFSNAVPDQMNTDRKVKVVS